MLQLRLRLSVRKTLLIATILLSLALIEASVSQDVPEEQKEFIETVQQASVPLEEWDQMIKCAGDHGFQFVASVKSLIRRTLTELLKLLPFSWALTKHSNVTERMFQFPSPITQRVSSITNHIKASYHQVRDFMRYIFIWFATVPSLLSLYINEGIGPCFYKRLCRQGNWIAFEAPAWIRDMIMDKLPDVIQYAWSQNWFKAFQAGFVNKNCGKLYPQCDVVH